MGSRKGLADRSTWMSESTVVAMGVERPVDVAKVDGGEVVSYRMTFDALCVVYLFVALLYLGAGVLLIVLGIVKDNRYLIPGVPLVLLSAAPLVTFRQRRGTCVVLTIGTLTIPQYGRMPRKMGGGQVVIPVEEISGVGLVYRQFGKPNNAVSGPGRRGSGWRPAVWQQASGSTQPVRTAFSLSHWELGLFVVQKVGMKRVSLPAEAKNDPILSTNMPQLEASIAGQVTRDIFQRVLALQGPDGQLRKIGQQKDPELGILSGSQVTGWWSPDGASGPPEVPPS